MMSSDVNTSLAEELSSSYLWQSAVSIACGLDHFHGAHVFFLQEQHTRTPPFVQPYSPQPLNGSNQSLKAIQHIPWVMRVFLSFNTPYANPSI